LIKRIEINNYQSHKYSELILHPGINTLIGSSDNGKTAILRALLWGITNRPMGISFVSHWNAEEKTGEPIDFTSVLIETDKCIVERRRKKGEKKEPGINGYSINGKELSAIGTDVPEEVVNALNITEVNIQKQMDSPFLLSSSSGEVARFLNKTIRLDVIDKILSLVESKKRKSKVDLIATEKLIEELDESLLKLDWIEEASKYITKAERIEKMKGEQEENCLYLSGNIEIYKDQEEILNFIDLEKVQNVMGKWEKVNIKLSSLSPVYENIKEEMEKYFDCVDIIKKVGLEKGFEYLKEYEKLNQKYSNLGADLSFLEESIEKHSISSDIIKKEDLTVIQETLSGFKILLKEKQEKEDIYEDVLEDIEYYIDYKEKIEKIGEEIKELESQFPDVCPLCGERKRGK